ncbi:hypothetical protein C8J57DRAFT_1357392 [Mycena rebaudengoi]|nr:hypothetical protein C8J57DRAFT_1357392 [Mycena rebaudengoi]
MRYPNARGFRGWGIPGQNVAGDWARYGGSDVYCQCNSQSASSPLNTIFAWLSQANYIFGHLKAISKYENYVVFDSISLQIYISPSATAHPQVYLFVCPADSLQIGLCSFRWPECPAYWSFDRTGSTRLSTEEATRLGLPKIRLEAHITGLYWDASVYAGLRQLHQGKGFDPETQDLARRLDYLLFELCTEQDVSFAHVDEFGEAQDVRDSGLSEKGQSAAKKNSERQEMLLDEEANSTLRIF